MQLLQLIITVLRLCSSCRASVCCASFLTGVYMYSFCNANCPLLLLDAAALAAGPPFAVHTPRRAVYAASATIDQKSLTRRSALLLDCRRVGDMGEHGERHFCGDSGGCSGSTRSVRRRTLPAEGAALLHLGLPCYYVLASVIAW
jgi:hypothetical protein